LEERIIQSLDSFLPSYWSRGNPVDMVATIGMEAYIKSLEVLISWDKVDAVISLSGDAGPLAMILPDVKKRAESIIPPEKMERIGLQVSEARAQIFQRVCDLIEKYQKPIFAVGANLVRGKGGAQPDFTLAQFRTPERAVQAAGALYQYSRYRKAVGME
jgi:acyl-CoA synthetase (NDP forming)